MTLVPKSDLLSLTRFSVPTLAGFCQELLNTVYSVSRLNEVHLPNPEAISCRRQVQRILEINGFRNEPFWSHYDLLRFFIRFFQVSVVLYCFVLHSIGKRYISACL